MVDLCPDTGTRHFDDGSGDHIAADGGEDVGLDDEESFDEELEDFNAREQRRKDGEGELRREKKASATRRRGERGRRQEPPGQAPWEVNGRLRG